MSAERGADPVRCDPCSGEGAPADASLSLGAGRLGHKPPMVAARPRPLLLMRPSALRLRLLTRLRRVIAWEEPWDWDIEEDVETVPAAV
jgi:hypothetical protein